MRAMESRVTRPFLVLEDITTRRRLFRAFGVIWSATPYAWIGPLSWLVLGLAMAYASRGSRNAPGVLAAGVGYGALLYAANVLHSVGHVIAARVVGAPVASVLVTSTRDVILYAQPGASAPPHRRVGRALGGPVANLVVGLALLFAGQSTHVRWMTMAGLVNVCIAAWTLMPIPSLDGSVIWSNVMHWKHTDAT
jgi:hypothetical protein